MQIIASRFDYVQDPVFYVNLHGSWPIGTLTQLAGMQRLLSCLLTIFGRIQ